MKVNGLVFVKTFFYEKCADIEQFKFAIFGDDKKRKNAIQVE